MSRRLRTLLLIASLPWALSQDATPPLVAPGAALSASAFRAMLDARNDAIAVAREAVIEARRQQVALRDLVSAIEAESGIGGADVGSVAPWDEPTNPWSEAGIVSGQVARAAAVNDLFGRFAEDLNNIREFQTLLLRDNDALYERIVALEALAGIDADDVPPLNPDEDVVVVPHAFDAGALMRASEMNANLTSVDEGTVAESAMAAGIHARLALMAARGEVLAGVFEPQPTFTWRIGTVHRSSDLDTESYFIFRTPGAFETITVRVTGPNGFDRERTITDPATTGFSWSDELLPSGTYAAEATVGGQDFASSITYDATLFLELPVFELRNVSTERVDVHFEAVDGAKYYDVMLRPEDRAWTKWHTSLAFEGEAETFSFTDLELDPTQVYDVWVRTYTVPAPWDPAMVPEQVDRSYGIEQFSPPAPGG